jgi:SEC-C motif-containing protein
MPKSPADLACPCTSGVAFERCCGRFIESGAPAPGAAELMRSRYTAYVRENSGYLLATWHARTRPPEILFEQPGPRWLGLEIRRAVEQDANHATVEFVARLRIGGRARRMHETSRFERTGDRWYYVDGDLHS